MQMGLDDALLDELRFLPFRVYATPNCEVCPFSLSNWDSKAYRYPEADRPLGIS